jgi:hypothetical protein
VETRAGECGGRGSAEKRRSVYLNAVRGQEKTGEKGSRRWQQWIAGLSKDALVFFYGI